MGTLLNIAVSPRVLLGPLLYKDVAESLTWAGRKKRNDDEAEERGPAIEWVQRVLMARTDEGNPVAGVTVVESRSPDLSLRAYHFCRSWGVPLERSDFISARSLETFLKAWKYTLYLSGDRLEVYEAAMSGTVGCMVEEGGLRGVSGADMAPGGHVYGYFLEAASSLLTGTVSGASYREWRCRAELTSAGLREFADELGAVQDAGFPARICIEWK